MTARPKNPVAPIVEDYNPHDRVPCPECRLHVGVRDGRLNRHVVGQVRMQDIVEPDGVRSSPRGFDGYCVASGRPIR